MYQFSSTVVTKYRKPGGLKQICCLTVMEAKDPKSRCQQGYDSSETCSAECFLASFWLLVFFVL